MSLYNVNKATLLGNVSQEPQQRMTQGGTAVTNFSMATNHSVKRNEQWESVPTFHNIVCWGKLAEFVAQNLWKGVQVYVEGRITTRSWEHEGKKYYKTEIVAEKVIPMKSNDRDNHSEPTTPEDEHQPTHEQVSGEDISDEIPF